MITALWGYIVHSSGDFHDIPLGTIFPLSPPLSSPAFLHTLPLVTLGNRSHSNSTGSHSLDIGNVDKRSWGRWRRGTSGGASRLCAWLGREEEWKVCDEEGHD